MKDYPVLYQDPPTRPSAPTVARAAPHVCVLLGLYNGAPFLAEQLASLGRQTHRNWSLVIRDDGSEDGGTDVARKFMATHPSRNIHIDEGGHVGFARCFLTLLSMTDPASDAVAFCDQDDVWRPGKLSRALATLATVPDGTPALYCGRTIIADEALGVLGMSPLMRRPASFLNALVQCIAGGNTMVMNRAALTVLRRAAAYAGPVPSHDWWAYQMISGAGGRILYDAQPQVYYRQHQGNAVGANSGLRAKLDRMAGLAAGKQARWTDDNLAALGAASSLLTRQNRHTLSEFAALRRLPPTRRLAAFRALGLYRQTRPADIALNLAALTGWL